MAIDEEHISYHQREGDIDQYPHYRHEIAIKELTKRVDTLDTFKSNAELPIAYIESVIKRNNEKAEFFKKTAYNIAGWGIMGLMTWIGLVFASIVWPALMTKLRQYLGGF